MTDRCDYGTPFIETELFLAALSEDLDVCVATLGILTVPERAAVLRAVKVLERAWRWLEQIEDEDMTLEELQARMEAGEPVEVASEPPSRGNT